MAAGGATLIFGQPTATGRFEEFQLDGRYIDVEQVDMELLNAIAGRIEMGVVETTDVKSIVGVRDAIAIAGADTLRTWHDRLKMTDDVATSEARRLAGRIRPVRALCALTWARSDEISYFARVSPVLLAGLGLLGAVNREWVASDDPKWLPWQVRFGARIGESQLFDRREASDDCLGEAHLVGMHGAECPAVVDRPVPAARTVAGEWPSSPAV